MQGSLQKLAVVLSACGIGVGTLLLTGSRVGVVPPHLLSGVRGGQAAWCYDLYDQECQGVDYSCTNIPCQNVGGGFQCPGGHATKKVPNNYKKAKQVTYDAFYTTASDGTSVTCYTSQPCLTGVRSCTVGSDGASQVCSLDTGAAAKNADYYNAQGSGACTIKKGSP